MTQEKSASDKPITKQNIEDALSRAEAELKASKLELGAAELRLSNHLAIATMLEGKLSALSDISAEFEGTDELKLEVEAQLGERRAKVEAQRTAMFQALSKAQSLEGRVEIIRSLIG